MKLLRLYIEDFLCYESSFIDFSEFNSALIVAKISNNDLVSNGAGKSTIFRAIEYVLFNEAGANLEKVIRDDTSSCRITLDVEVNNIEYRISRKRTKKGSSDLSLWERTGESGEFKDVYGDSLPVTDSKFWKEKSGRRASDTEKELLKLVKVNFKAFRSTVHFVQGDISGLPNLSPEKRKSLLREALNLVIYSKLEKIAKEEATHLSKNIDKAAILLENLGNPSQELDPINSKIKENTDQLNVKTNDLIIEQQKENLLRSKIEDLNKDYASLNTKNAELKNKEKDLKSSISRLETSIKEYSTKKSNIAKSAQTLVSELDKLRDDQTELLKKDFSQIEIFNENIALKREQSAAHKNSIQTLLLKIEELKIPLPDNAECKYCRQVISKDHRKSCQSQIDNDLLDKQKLIQEDKKKISEISEEITKIQREVNSLQIFKQKLEDINSQISSKNKEILDKKALHKEYSEILNKFKKEFEEKQIDLQIVLSEIEKSSIAEENRVKQEIDQENKNLEAVLSKILSLNKEITHIHNEMAVLNHALSAKKSDIDKKALLEKEMIEFKSQHDAYPTILQALSSSGIPGLIIQNVLDDLQIEANNLLSQLKPGLQLQFVTEKTKGNGDQDETLEINYLYNGKERDYDLLSGAMKLSIMFSLKLGLFCILQKLIDMDIKFLLIDEVDQALDKASVDAFAEIVKFFQKDFKILVITHNDRLKDKFSHAILVDQDINMVSNAKTVSSW